MTFQITQLRDKPTNKQTNRGKNMTFLAKVIIVQTSNVWTLVKESLFLLTV